MLTRMASARAVSGVVPWVAVHLGWVGLLALPSVAWAQETPAQLFEAGRDAFEAGQFELAAGLFEEAFERSDDPVMLYNVGQARERMGDASAAAAAYRGYLDRAPTSEYALQLEARIARLEGILSEDGTAPDSASRAGAHVEESVRADEGGVEDQWWFWVTTGLGAVLLATAIAVPLALLGRDEATPQPGDVGGVVMTLRWP